MPHPITIDDRTHQVATEEELLAFANSIRQAGGAGVLDALLPSVQGNQHKCLIANALNFGCEVVPAWDALDITMDEGKFKSGASKWIMRLPDNLTQAQRDGLNKVKGVNLRHFHEDSLYPSVNDEDFYYLTLPEPIGNAADAFDEGAAFQELAVDEAEL